MVLGILAAATLGGVFALDRLGFGVYSLAAIAVTGGIAVAYLWEYSRRLELGPNPSADLDNEPFDDPVEAALRRPADPVPTQPADSGPTLVPSTIDPDRSAFDDPEDEPFDDPVEEADRNPVRPDPTDPKASQSPSATDRGSTPAEERDDGLE